MTTETYTIAIPGREIEFFYLEEYAFMAKVESGGEPKDRRRVAAIVREIKKMAVGDTYDVNHGPLDPGPSEDGQESWIVTRTA